MTDDREDPGGLGDGAPPSRSDMADVRRAVRQDWPIPADVQVRVIQHLVDLIDPEYIHADGRRPSARTRISAARTLGALSSLALRQQALDLARDKRDGTGQGRTLADLVEEAERLAEEFDRARDPAAAGDVGGGSPDGPAPGPVA